MIGCVALGAAGGNICDEMARLGFPSIAINSSQSDLNSLEHIQESLTLFGSEGVGKQRKMAIELMRDNWESVITFIKKHMDKPSIEVVFVVFSTSGGTGSGLSSMLIEFLQESLEKTVVAVPVLPDHSEFTGNQINTQEALEELSQLECAILPLDNQSISEQFNQRLPKNMLYKEINTQFAMLMNKLLSYTEKHSKYGVMDKRDLRQLFATKGVMTIAETNLYNLSNLTVDTNHFTNTIQKSFKNTIFTPIQYQQIAKAGIIFDGNESLLEYLRYDALFDTFTNNPIELFEGNYTDGKGTVISILSGLNWMYNRVKQIDEIIEKQRIALTHNDDTVYKSKNTNKTTLLDKITNKQPIQKKRSVTDILSKYSR